MPIEIKELHIRMAVNVPSGGKPAGALGPAPGAEGDAMQSVVAECVEQVMQIIRDQKER